MKLFSQFHLRIDNQYLSGINEFYKEAGLLKNHIFFDIGLCCFAKWHYLLI